MIHLTRGNLLKADAEALVNTVNTVGVMGRGVALQISRAYPEVVKPYVKACEDGSLTPGKVLTVGLGRLHNPRYVINVPTKRHWKGKSRIEDIESGLVALAAEIGRLGITSVAVPPLGCGLGGLDWAQVRPKIEAVLGKLPGVDVYLYESTGSPDAAEMPDRTAKPKMTPAQASLLGLMQRYLDAMMDVQVTLLEIHKLMYFLQSAGELLRLTFTKGRYGPYAGNLAHLLKRMEGHYIVGFGDGEEAPGKVIDMRPDAASVAEEFLAGYDETRYRMDRVVQLIDGFETPDGMELLASVHWIAVREGKGEDVDAVTVAEGVAAWNARKRKLFSADQVLVALEQIRKHGWLSARHDETLTS